MLAGAPPKPLARKPVAKPAPRESALSTYASGEYAPPSGIHEIIRWMRARWIK